MVRRELVLQTGIDLDESLAIRVLDEPAWRKIRPGP